MATIVLYANKINQMPCLIKDIQNSVTDYSTELSALKTKMLTINKSVCNLDDVMSSIQTSTQTQEQKNVSLDTFKKNSEQFIADVELIDSKVADVVKKNQDDFYKEYSYLKPDDKKGFWEKISDGLKKTSQWCKKHWKELATVIAAVVVAILTSGSILIVIGLVALLLSLTGCSNPNASTDVPTTESPPATAKTPITTTESPTTTTETAETQTPSIVSEEQLLECGWDSSVVTDEMVTELNYILEKYEINTSDRISHFMAQCLRESARGTGIYEWGSEEYFANTLYGSKYRGVGYIHMTWDYSYQAFVTFLALQEYPQLSDYATFRSPNSNDVATIDEEYTKLLNGAKELGIDIRKYTDIYDIGYTYVSQNYAWESAGYDWSVKDLNVLVDSGASVDDVSNKVNKWDTEQAFKEKRDYYNDIIEKCIFK